MFKVQLAILLHIAVLLNAAPAKELPWSFLPLEKQELPKVQQTDWAQQRMDHFVLSKMEEKELQPAPPADDRVLLRRLYFDLIGLPPTMEQWTAFQNRAQSCRTTAIREEIEQLLASPHYGERWARHWLDLARYTDKTAKWLKSAAEPWRYRDWVIQAFNDDLPYPDFVRRQLANDLIEGHDPKDNAALGFLGLSPTYWKELKLPPEVIKTTVADEWEERMDAVGRTFLGLTLGCARCHDHKTDPVTQADYYAIAGVFASVRISDRPTISEELWVPVRKAREEVAKLEKEIDAQKKKKKDADQEKISELEKKVETIKSNTPHYDVPMVGGVMEAALYVKPAGKHGTTLDYQTGKSRDLPIHKRGNPNVVGEVIPRQFLGAFPFHNGKPRSFEHGSGRLDLAEAIVGDAAPLSARVMVNRVWQHHFGTGLCATPSEIGHSGEAPTHPDLLNDLANRFVKNGWSIKWLHREVLQSATWQQSIHNSESIETDPANQHLARMNRRRLDVEAWRDALLQTTESLDHTLGGKPTDLNANNNFRRTIYGAIHRREPNQFLRAHDFPDPTAHSPARQLTITPLQQLFSLNGPTLQFHAETLSKNLLKEPNLQQRIRTAYQKLFQREPRQKELEIAKAFLRDKPNDLHHWTQYAHALLVSNEFLFIE